jgi:NADH:ubiquinone oxidoreductase subunit D
MLQYINNNKQIKNINNYSSMEEIITHFKYWSDGFNVDPNWTYQSIESPKGEFGVSLISDGSSKPYRCKVRSSSYQHLQVLPQIAKGHYLADLVTLIGTIDIVFGEIDR